MVDWHVIHKVLEPCEGRYCYRLGNGKQQISMVRGRGSKDSMSQRTLYMAGKQRAWL